MIIAYNGYAQDPEKKKVKSITTFPNGDESIIIIENAGKCVIQLSSTQNSNEYEMLDLSNHEAAHRLSKKREILKRQAADQLDDQYVIGRREDELPEEVQDDDEKGA